MIDLEDAYREGQNDEALCTLIDEDSDEEFKQLAKSSIRGVHKQDKKNTHKTDKHYKDSKNLLKDPEVKKSKQKPEIKKPEIPNKSKVPKQISPPKSETPSEEKYVLLKILTQTFRASTITKELEWRKIHEELKKKSPEFKMYFTGEFNYCLTVKDFLSRIVVETDQQRILQFHELSGKTSWLGTNLIIWLRDCLNSDE